MSVHFIIAFWCWYSSMSLNRLKVCIPSIYMQKYRHTYRNIAFVLSYLTSEFVAFSWIISSELQLLWWCCFAPSYLPIGSPKKLGTYDGFTSYLIGLCCSYCPVWWISSGRFVFCPLIDAELSAMPFIWFNNIGVYTSVKLWVLEEKQDQSPSPLCAVIKPTAGSSHYAIRARRLTMFCGTAEPYLSISPPLLSTCIL